MKGTFVIITMIMNFIVSGQTTELTILKETMLFDFSKTESETQWVIVNDTVMGGRSESSVHITKDDDLLFQGNLSLENNGGFASVRSRKNNYNLEEYNGIALRLKGDGNKYNFSIQTDWQMDGVYYYYDFQTNKDEWITIFAPFKDFVPKFRGRNVPNAPELNRSSIESFGILISDKQEGTFSLTIDWIKTVLERS